MERIDVVWHKNRGKTKNRIVIGIRLHHSGIEPEAPAWQAEEKSSELGSYFTTKQMMQKKWRAVWFAGFIIFYFENNNK